MSIGRPIADRRGNALPAEAFLKANSGAVSTVIALGRTPTVAAAVLAAAKAALS